MQTFCRARAQGDKWSFPALVWELMNVEKIGHGDGKLLLLTLSILGKITRRAKGAF